MSTTDYLINGAFIAMVIMQARERRLDRRALVLPLVLVFFVAQQYLHTIPTTGNDLVLIAALAAAGLGLGLLSGFATHVRPGSEGFALARVGWVAGLLLVAGISSRMVFAFVVTHGGEVHDSQLQHSPSDQRSGVAGCIGIDGDLRGHGPGGHRLPARSCGSGRHCHHRTRDRCRCLTFQYPNASGSHEGAGGVLSSVSGDVCEERGT